MLCNNYSESQSCCTNDTLGIVITSDFDFSSGYSSSFTLYETLQVEAAMM